MNRALANLSNGPPGQAIFNQTQPSPAITPTPSRMVVSRRFQSIINIISSYFTDLYFNLLHRHAVMSVGPESSITDEYRSAVSRFIQGLKTDSKHYRAAVTKLHQYFTQQTSFTSTSFTDFVNLIIEQFVPPEYYTLLTSGDKDELLSSIVCDVASHVGVYVTIPEMLRKIIDEHDKNVPVTVKMIEEHGCSTLIVKRDTVANGFLRKSSQTQEYVPVHVVEALREELAASEKERARDRNEYLKTNMELTRLNGIVHEMRVKEQKYQRFIQVLNEQRRNLISLSSRPAATFETPVLDQVVEMEMERSDEDEMPPPQSRKQRQRAHVSPISDDEPDLETMVRPSVGRSSPEQTHDRPSGDRPMMTFGSETDGEQSDERPRSGRAGEQSGGIFGSPSSHEVGMSRDVPTGGTLLGESDGE
jgi:hypothetical protein